MMMMMIIITIIIIVIIVTRKFSGRSDREDGNIHGAPGRPEKGLALCKGMSPPDPRASRHESGNVIIVGSPVRACRRACDVRTPGHASEKVHRLRTVTRSFHK